MNFNVYWLKHCSSSPLLAQLIALSEPLINNLTRFTSNRYPTVTHRQTKHPRNLHKHKNCKRLISFYRGHSGFSNRGQTPLKSPHNQTHPKMGVGNCPIAMAPMSNHYRRRARRENEDLSTFLCLLSQHRR